MDSVAEDPDEVEQFVREATIWGQLRHPCIVQFLGITLFDEYQSPLGVVQVRGVRRRKYHGTNTNANTKYTCGPYGLHAHACT